MSCSYQGTNYPQLLRLLQFYITNGFELFKQVNTRNPSVAISLLNYAWNHRDRQAILDMLFAAILGVGVTAQVGLVRSYSIGFSRSISPSIARSTVKSIC